MMTIPNVPTDNLYKFLALTGIFIWLVAFIYPESKRQELTDEVTQLNGEIYRLDYEMKPLEAKTKELKKQIAKLDKLCGCGFKSIVTDSMIVRPKIVDGEKNIVELSREIDTLMKEQDDLIHQTNIKSMDIRVKRELIDNKIANVNELTEASLFLVPFGIILSMVGFFLWYYQTQTYQDSLLRQQYLQLHKYERCQSCWVPLASEEAYRLLTADEKQKAMYCSTCFKDGNFIEPEMTLKQMKAKVRARCKEIKFGWLATWIWTSRLDYLERWLPRFKWETRTEQK